jgi:hypothetical protein
MLPLMLEKATAKTAKMPSRFESALETKQLLNRWKVDQTVWINTRESARRKTSYLGNMKILLLTTLHTLTVCQSGANNTVPRT